MFAVEDGGEAFHGVFDRAKNAGNVGEDLCHVEGLGEETLKSYGRGTR